MSDFLLIFWISGIIWQLRLVEQEMNLDDGEYTMHNIS